MSRSSQIKDLINRSSQCFQDGDFNKALKLSQKLILAGAPQGYMVKYRCYSMRNQTNEALQCLREYTQVFPQDIVAWKSLAEFCRDHDFFDEGISAYDKALECEDAPMEKIVLAKASIKVRAKDFNNALNDLEKIIDSEELALPIEVMKLSCLNGLEKFEQVVKTAPQVLEKVQIDAELNPSKSIPMMNYNTRFELAYAHWKISKDQSKSLNYLFQALRYIKVATPAALELLREINAQNSNDRCKLFGIIITAKTNEPVMQHGHPHEDFVRQYDVVAEDPEECLEFICELETEIKSSSLRIRKFQENPELEIGTYKGVYFQSLPELLHNHH